MLTVDMLKKLENNYNTLLADHPGLPKITVCYTPKDILTLALDTLKQSHHTSLQSYLVELGDTEAKNANVEQAELAVTEYFLGCAMNEGYRIGWPQNEQNTQTWYSMPLLEPVAFEYTEDNLYGVPGPVKMRLAVNLMQNLLSDFNQAGV